MNSEMNRALQWKLIAGFILVFIAGGMTGAFFAAAHAHHIFFESHQPGLMANRMKERLRSELNLTPDQAARIAPIVDKMAAQLDQIRMATGRQVHEAFIKAHHEMAESLTEEQRQKLQRLEARHRLGHRVPGAQSPSLDAPSP
jgi:Spy/CpxP family protein refolding chaperone